MKLSEEQEAVLLKAAIIIDQQMDVDSPTRHFTIYHALKDVLAVGVEIAMQHRHDVVTKFGGRSSTCSDAIQTGEK